jgi:hypothetical protein
MEKPVLHIDEVIEKITEALRQSNGIFVEDIANRILSNKVKYIEDNFFEEEN